MYNSPKSASICWARIVLKNVVQSKIITVNEKFLKKIHYLD